MICASLYRPFFIQNLLRYLAEKILLLNTANFRGDYPPNLTLIAVNIIARYFPQQCNLATAGKKFVREIRQLGSSSDF